MRRAIAHGQTWWMRGFLLVVAASIVAGLAGAPLPAGWVYLAVFVLLIGLASVRAPRLRDPEPVEVGPPVRERWAALNSPATKVPSHGLRAYGQEYAIDILRPTGLEAPKAIGWGLSSRRPETFATFGASVHAMAPGTVVATGTRQRDHRDRATWPALGYLFVVEAVAREVGGARFVLGNHVIVEHGDGVFSAYAHLRRRSVRVQVGDRVEVGEVLGEVGNSGNTTEPHLHVQLMDDRHPCGAAGIPFRWRSIDIRPGDVDKGFPAGAITEEVTAGLPANGQVFTVAPPT